MKLHTLANPPGSRHAMTVGAIAAILALASASAGAVVIKPYFEFKKPKMIEIPGDISLDTNGTSAPVSFAGGSSTTSGAVKGFEGISQYDGASFGRNFIPPDTNGAVGKTQFMEVSNGSYAIYDKATGTRTSLVSDVAFWATAGQTGANGDSRVMYNIDAQRWIAMSFGGNVKDLQIAISDTSNALGTWKSTKFEGYAGFGFGATADYPTLALDKNAVYIGTNNFAKTSSTGANNFRGTTLNVIPIDSLFGSGAPTTTGIKQFETPYNGTTQIEDRGFAQQGVNSRSAGTSGTVVAASLFLEDNLAFKVNGLTSTSATGATVGATTFLGLAPFTTPGAARQPDAIPDAQPANPTGATTYPNNKRVVAAGDERISSSVYESGGRIYSLMTVDPLGQPGDFSRIHYSVINATTFAVLDEGDIGTGDFDYYQGSIAVNSQGRMVISYNRSGLDPLNGKISVMARAYATDASGHLYALSDEQMLKESLVDDYHNGSIAGFVALGRQRWGDYSQVTIDPDDENQFWLVGEFAREYNNAAGGHPGGTGGSRWGTFIAQFSAVPEPGTLLMSLLALAAGGVVSRRRVTH